MMLLDRDGKLVEIDPRGERLEPAVAQLLGKDAEPPADAARVREEIAARFRSQGSAKPTEP
jgi:hypothetical protein